MTSALAAATHPLVTGQRWVRRMGAANELVRSGAFDQEWFEAQTGRRYQTLRGAILHYLRSPRGRGYSPHPLFEADYVNAQGRGEALVKYLTTPRLARISPHPMFDVTRARRQLEAARPGEPVVHPWAEWVARATPTTPVPVPSGVEPLEWGELRRLLLAAVAEWAARGEPDPGPTDWDEGRPRRRGLTSVVFQTGADLRGPTLARHFLIGLPRGAECEVVLAGAATRAQFCCLRAAARGLPLVTVEQPSAGGPEVVNRAVLASAGEFLVLCGPGARIDVAAADQLTGALRDPRVGLAQPLNVHQDSTVASAGAYLPAGPISPSPLLEGHPVEDGLRLGACELPAAYSGVVAVRASDLVAVGGLDEGLPDALGTVDLSLRLKQAGRGTPWLVSSARAVLLPSAVAGLPPAPESVDLLRERWQHCQAGGDDLLARLGLRAVGGGGTGHRLEAPRIERLPVAVHEGRPRLRWAVDIAAPCGAAGDSWGDRHFARSLAAALGRLGQDVAVDHREAWRRPSRHLDDVVLALRGKYEVPPEPGATNVLWIISHPDEVTEAEAAGFDLVFAAGEAWASAKSVAWGREIVPLLQCTDPGIFNPERALPDTGAPVVFVGNSRAVLRPAVMYALSSGADVEVYGRGWETLIPEERVMRPVIPNDKVGEVYAGAGVVLNDHWEDMRRDGFLSNRLFDAVASGARVVSDPVPGMVEVFGDAVRLFETERDMHRLLSEPYELNFLDRQARETVASSVAARHSFDDRAEALLTAVLDRRARNS